MDETRDSIQTNKVAIIGKGHLTFAALCADLLKECIILGPSVEPSIPPIPSVPICASKYKETPKTSQKKFMSRAERQRIINPIRGRK